MKQIINEIDQKLNELLEKLTEEEYTNFIEGTPELSEYDRLKYIAEEYAEFENSEELFTEPFLQRVRKLVNEK